MKLTVWIRPDQRDPTGRTITRRTDAKYESLDTPMVQNYGRKLMNATDRTAEKEEQS